MFAAKGSVTAGNSSQTSDGSGGLIVVSEAALKRYNLTPLALRLLRRARRAARDHGHRPHRGHPRRTQARRHLGQGPGLGRAERSLRRSVPRGAERPGQQGPELDRAKVNPNGGAIALGHPLGATGAIRAASVIHGLRRTGGYGMVTMCVGAGQGAAGIFERI